MTNEEKVDMLVSNYYINESDSPNGAQGVRYGAEKMAEWKDQQFKEYLEKKRLEYAHKREAHKFNACNEIINELFPEQEQDNSDRED